MRRVAQCAAVLALASAALLVAGCNKGAARAMRDAGFSVLTIANKVNADGSLSGSPQIGNHVEFGANAIALGSIQIGNNAVIGAGSVVTKDIPDHAIAAGVPAKIIGIRQ